MTSAEDEGRPSFSRFWKRSKTSDQQTQFVQFSPPGASSAAPTGPEDREQKAQARRAQVRKAQVEHRQRKTNYVKKLELDAANLRDAIADAEADVAVLRRENAVMQGRLDALSLGRVAVDKPLPALPTAGTLGPGFSGSLAAGGASAAWLGDAVSATLVVDEVMRKPCYRIVSDSHGSPPTNNFGVLPLLSPAQEVQAINFILALEHVCWDHFHLHDFPAHGDESLPESSHALLASTLCLSHAPSPTFDQISQFQPTSSSSSSTSPSPSPVSPWQAPALTLRNLHVLASSLPVDDKDLTPVQAWFELAGRYPAASLMLPEVVEALKREFVGVVKCFEFGATIERGAFDSVVGRVLRSY